MAIQNMREQSYKNKIYLLQEKIHSTSNKQQTFPDDKKPTISGSVTFYVYLTLSLIIISIYEFIRCDESHNLFIKIINIDFLRAI